MEGAVLLATSLEGSWKCPTARTRESNQPEPSKSLTTSKRMALSPRTSLGRSGRVNSVNWCTRCSWITKICSSTRWRPSASGRTSTRPVSWPGARFWWAWCWSSWLLPSRAPWRTACVANLSWDSWEYSLSVFPVSLRQGYFSLLMENIILLCWESLSSLWVIIYLHNNRINRA